MANHNETQGTKQQGDNRRAGDQDGNRGADPKRGSQGVSERRPEQVGDQSDHGDGTSEYDRLQTQEGEARTGGTQSGKQGGGDQSGDRRGNEGVN